VWRKITAAIEHARGEVWICGICLKEFLDGANPISRVIRQLLIDDEDIQLKLVLLDTGSDAAKLRSAAEQGIAVPYEEGQLFNDMSGSVASLRALYNDAASANRFKIEARFCNVMPPAYIVGTPQSLYLEVYHFGRTPTDGPCIGGFIPTLHFNSASETYRRMSQHFKYIWNSRSEFDVKGSQTVGTLYDGRILKVRTLDEVEADLRGQRGCPRYPSMSTAAD
jgi:hypothetical protein